MRTTLDLNQDLIEKAQALTNIKEKTALIHEALRILIAQAAQKDLASYAGSQTNIKSIPRRRSA